MLRRMNPLLKNKYPVYEINDVYRTSFAEVGFISLFLFVPGKLDLQFTLKNII